MKSLIIGNGQIGSALYEIFSRHHECFIRDIKPFDVAGIEILHIAYRYTDDFVKQTNDYIQQYTPSLTIIHSSVPVGTTMKLGIGVVHSPERGRHPNLAFEMKVFPKFVGGSDAHDVEEACEYFEACGWETVPVDDPCITELIKLASNVHLGLEIAWRQEVNRFVEQISREGDVRKNIEVYEMWEDSYNQGHAHLGHKQLVRPRMSPAPIGGHCILPCKDILASQFQSLAFDFIGRSNAKRQAEVKTGAHVQGSD